MNSIRYPTSTAALRVMRGSAVGIHGRPLAAVAAETSRAQ